MMLSDHKTWISGNRKRTHYMVRWVVLTLFPTSGKVYFWRTPRRPTIRNTWFRQWNTGEVWAAISWYSILLVPLISLMAELLQDITWGWTDRAIKRILWSRYFLPKKSCSFPRRQFPHSHSWNSSVVVWKAWRSTSTSSLISTINQIWTSLNLSCQFWRRVRNRFPTPTSLKQLEDVLREEWYKIPLETVQNLYESIPRKTAALLKAKGGPTAC
jgi:hypothetical protein